MRGGGPKMSLPNIKSTEVGIWLLRGWITTWWPWKTKATAKPTHCLSIWSFPKEKSGGYTVGYTGSGTMPPKVWKTREIE